MRSFTGMDRNGPDYRNGLPEWTFICVLEYFSLGFQNVLPRMYTDSDKFEILLIKVQLNVFRTMRWPRPGTHMYMLIGHVSQKSRSL